MCGRVALFSPLTRFVRLLDAVAAAGLPELRPSWNVGPQRTLFALSERSDERVIDAYRWGLIPGWAKDPTISNRLVNARGETAFEKPSFRAAFAQRPCVIPVDGYYEWHVSPTGIKQPHYFTRRDGAPVLIGGLYELWRDPSLGPEAPLHQTCCVVTTAPSVDVIDVHDRMPVVLELDDVASWISPPNAGERQLLIRSAPPQTLRHHEVGAAVGAVRNDGPELIVPFETPSLF